MGNYKDLIEQLKIWKHQTLTFLKAFAAAFISQMIAVGLDSSTEFKTYMNSALVALGSIILGYINPRNTTYGLGSKKDTPPEPGE